MVKKNKASSGLYFFHQVHKSDRSSCFSTPLKRNICLTLLRGIAFRPSTGFIRCSMFAHLIFLQFLPIDETYSSINNFTFSKPKQPPMRKLYPALFLVFFTSFSTIAQVSITALEAPVTETFNSLASTGTTNEVTTLPIGWTFIESGTNANTTYAAGTGSSNTGNTYSFGT